MEKDQVNQVLNKLIQADLVRLIEGDTPSDTQIELVHNSLLYNWPTLVVWLEDEQLAKSQRLRLSADAEWWAVRGKDPSLLLRGILLEEALFYKDLNELEAEFVKVSEDEQEQVEKEKKITQQREHELMQALAQQSRKYIEDCTLLKKNLNRQVLITVVFAVLAVISATFVFMQHKKIEDQKHKIVKIKETNTKKLEEQKKINEACREFGHLTMNLPVIFGINTPSDLKSQQIRQLQIRLKDLNYLANSEEIDGHWGPVTQLAFLKATKNFNTVCK